MDVLSIILTIIGIIIAIIFGYLQVVVPFIKGEVRLSKRFPFVESAEAAPAAEPRKKRRKKKHKRRFLIPAFAIGVIVLIIVLIKILVLQTTSLPPRPIAVMTFENLTGERNLDYLCKAIPNLLITNLEQSRHLSVMTWERMHDLLDALGKEDIELIDEDLGFQLCRMDGIEAIVMGSFTKAGDVVVTDAKVLDVATKKLIKTTSSKGEGVASILKMQIDELSREISRGVGLSERKVKATKLQITEVTTTSMDAYNYFLRGREEHEKYYYDDARQFLEKAIELDSTFASAYFYLSLAYTELLDYKARDQALEKAKVLSEKATEKERLYIEADYASRIEDDPEERFHILTQLATKYPKEKRANGYLGWYYYGKDLFYRALEEFNKALELDPDYGEALNGLAYTYAEMGDYAKAIEYFKRYAAVSPGDANPFDSMGDCYFRIGQLDDALVKYEEAIFVKPDFYISSARIAYIYALREEYIKTMEWIDHFVAAAPSVGVKAMGYTQKAFYNCLLGNFDQALDYLETAEGLLEPTEYDLGMAVVDFTRVLIYYDQRKLQLSRDYLEDSYANMPDIPANAVLYNYYLALIELKQGIIDSAKARLTTIKSLLPEVSIWYKDIALFNHDLLYAEVLLAQDSLEKSITVFEKLSPFEIERAPGEYLIGVYLPFDKDVAARAYYKRGDIDRAILQYEQLIDPDSNKRGRSLIRPTWHYALANLYEEKGQEAKAVEQYEKFLHIWKNADADRPKLIDAKKRLAKLK